MKPRPFRDSEWFMPLKPDGRNDHHRLPGMISGVYAIRDAKTQAVLYVGESHTRRLRSTIRRHLSRWIDKGQPREFYDRHAVEIAWYPLETPEAALEHEAWLIRHYCPRDNTKGLWEECGAHPHPGYAREDADWIERAETTPWAEASADDAVPF